MSSINLDLQPASKQDWRANIYARLIGFGLVYYFAVGFGVRLVTKPEGISIIWPAIGVALAALILIPPREWLSFLIVIFAINLYSNLASGVSLAASTGFAFANALEPAVGGWLMLYWSKERITFTRLRHVASLVAVAVLVVGLAALLWALIPTLTFGSPYIVTWISWWILDCLSMLIVTPFIVTWTTGGNTFSGRFLVHKFETFAWLIILTGSTWLMFGVKKLDIYVEQNPYMLFPILIWIAFRFSPRGTASALVLTSVVALYSATLPTGFFPVGGDSPREHLISIQAFLCVASITTLILSTILTERRQAFADLEKQIVELKQAQAALLESESRIKSISNNFTAGMIYQVIIKRDGARKFTYLSDSVSHLYGISPEEGMADATLIYNKVHEDDIAQLIRIEEEAAKEISTFKTEVRLRYPPDEIRWSSLVSTPRLLEDGSTCWDGMEFVITERKEAELEREKLITELSTKNAELERFTYTVSHDLKSPIVTIRGFLGYLNEDALKGNTIRIKEDIQRIKNATDKMQDLLHDLLELSRIGRVMNAPQTIQFEELVHEALEIVNGQLEGLHITVVTQPDLTAVYGDRQRLTEVLQNLLDNAAKYMDEQPDPRIEIGQQGEQDGKLIFYVKDNGIGIPPEYHGLIFGLFNKLDPKSDGTGIGLALVKRIIELHGGEIWVESEIGKGSTFFFSLPSNPDDRTSSATIVEKGGI